MNKVKRFIQNEQGKDFIVGDLHGCYEDFLQALKAIGFNEKTDRVFSVGDLIDRGPYNEECIELLLKPWFHAVQGNHEDMMIMSILDHNNSATSTWLGNGGNWIFKPSTWERRYTDARLTELATMLRALPYVIVVGEGQNRYNIVHAEFYRNTWSGNKNVCDKDIDEWTFDRLEENNLLWGRAMIKTGIPLDPAMQEGLSLTFVGHTPLRQVTRRLQQIYLDVGCVYYHISSNKSETNALVFACPQDQKVYSWSPMWKRIHTADFADIYDLDAKLNKPQDETRAS